MLVVVCIDTVSPHNLFYLSLFGFGGMTTRFDHYNITKKNLQPQYIHLTTKNLHNTTSKI